MSRFVLAACLFGAVVGCARKEPEPPPIVFGQKRFHVMGEGVVVVSGTRTGPGAWPANNSVLIHCERSQMQCLTIEVNEVSPGTVGDLLVPLVYPVTRWEKGLVVAEGEDLIGCRQESITLLLEAETVAWTQGPTKHPPPDCQPRPSYSWTVEDSPGWKKIKATWPAPVRDAG